MPKKPIDYSNTTFYRIICKDINITECYVGQTTNLTKRKSSHKQTYNNPNNKGYNYYVYEYIRNNGGFSNWDFLEIEKVKCDNIYDALRKERYWLEFYNASLNCVKPTRTSNEWYIDNKETQTEKFKIYYINNKEHIIEKTKEYYETNKENIVVKSKIYYEKNKEEKIEYSKKYQQEHKEQRAEYIKNYQQENKEQLAEYNKEYREKNKEKINCKCGAIYQTFTKARHIKTKRHIAYTENNQTTKEKI
jgi:hypothetical protein